MGVYWFITKDGINNYNHTQHLNNHLRLYHFMILLKLNSKTTSKASKKKKYNFIIILNVNSDLFCLWTKLMKFRNSTRYRRLIFLRSNHQASIFIPPSPNRYFYTVLVVVIARFRANWKCISIIIMFFFQKNHKSYENFSEFMWKWIVCLFLNW